MSVDYEIRLDENKETLETIISPGEGKIIRSVRKTKTTILTEHYPSGGEERAGNCAAYGRKLIEYMEKENERV